MEVLALHKASLCSPECFQAAWDHTDWWLVFAPLTCPKQESKMLSWDDEKKKKRKRKTGTFESAFHTLPPDPMTWQLVDSVTRRTGACLSVYLVLICREWGTFQEMNVVMFSSQSAGFFYLTYDLSRVHPASHPMLHPPRHSDVDKRLQEMDVWLRWK